MPTPTLFVAVVRSRSGSHWVCGGCDVCPSPCHCPANGRCRPGRCSPPTRRRVHSPAARGAAASHRCPSCRWCASASPVDPSRALLVRPVAGSIHVTFRPVVAPTVQSVTPSTSTPTAAKFAACCRSNRPLTRRRRVRYLRCPVENLPRSPNCSCSCRRPARTHRGPAGRDARRLHLLHARDIAGQHGATGRAERTALWQDSSLFQDSFFAARHAHRRFRARASSAR